MRGKRFCNLCLSLLCTVSLLAGCQGPGGKQPANDKLQTNAPVPADWAKGFQVGPQQEGESLYVTGYLDLEHKVPENVAYQYALGNRVRGERFYTLRCYDTDRDRYFYLDVHALDKGEPEQTIELLPQQWELPDGFIVSFDVAEEGYVFLLTADYTTDEKERRKAGSLQLVYADGQGALQSRADLTAVIPQELLVSVLEKGGYFYRDAEGYLYLCTATDTLLLVLDGDGNPVTQYDCSGSNPYRIQNGIQEPARDDSGRLVFPVMLGEEGRMRFLGREGNTLKELASLDEIITGRWCGMYGSVMYYVSGNTGAPSLMCWNVSTGLRERVLDLGSIGLSDVINIDIIPEGERELRLRSWTNKEDYVVTLSARKPDHGDAVTVAAVRTIYEGRFINSAIARMTRKAPLYTYTLELDKENEEAYRTRIMADIMAGGGPDILSVSREDMAILADRGALLPIDQFVSRETLDVLLPGIIQEGTRDGKLMGIAIEAVAGTMITSTDTWAGESWTLDDIMTLAEEKEGLEGILTGSLDTSDYYVLYRLVGRNLEDTRFVDMEKGVSRFEQENFMRVLETVKRFSGAGSSFEGDDRKMTKAVKEGTFLVEDETIFSPRQFPAMAGASDGWCNVVGYPRKSGSGNFIYGRYMMVVNASTKNPEAVSAFLEYLLSFENQATLTDGLSVRGDMADRLATFSDYNNCVEWSATGMKFVLPSWQDVTVFKEEYNAFMQSCVPRKNETPIFDLVWEEAEAFFSGDKDALTVTRAIDNRVQLYLDERK